MLDLAPTLRRWAAEGRAFAVASVVAVTGSAPRPPGAALAVDAAGEAAGSVSGGCVEGAVYELCRAALAEDRPLAERFGYSDEDAFAIGLTCGGVIDVLVVPVRPGSAAARLYGDVLAAVADGAPRALARVVEGPPALLGRPLVMDGSGTVRGGCGGPPELDRSAAAEAAALLALGRTGTVTIGADGSRCGRPVTLLVESSVPPPRMIVFGAIDYAAALARAGSFLGYHVTVCDARPVFATRARFPDADELVVAWPHTYLDRTPTDARTVLCVLTHDAKFDVPLLARALRLPVAYVGAMGSRRTHEDRLRRLRAEGLTEAELARLRSPIGLDLGARTPEETALSIAAEIVAHRHGATGAPLTGSPAPIHRRDRAGSGV
ncbi:xanthine dehydrogenase accessory factor [Streptomyces sp. TverLS-915]|uniref:XdhC family protein n=1 Tax=Streptomyces sp. TverLS-915 TaxID=1839763 RepID=UPI00081E1510|nr:XdhC/CoxI family protein [Streptomyces sp. TverLS-915]SCD43318.1 xanthine dehydrogenase accessory factor [Streptomyces sp. TverLS-915]